ncbi:transmembrane protein [Colletotrichum incanum]|uniref:Store-operated calcium entry-associated regulatory factor n=1 Tax=Colletotrichum incanum TaxID=1573173 RepID=A0A166P327_COLIC|nr:transmembrane protein [Colletotrichum incanum]
MHIPLTLGLGLVPFLPGLASAAKAPKNAILLSDVQSLTLRGKGAKTTHRRVAAAPQLKCVSSKAICDLHEIDVMRCTNQGAGYSSEDIQWSCVASLPEELKLGSTDVICEGYANSDDPYILRGSCGVEYRLALTEKGERRYPNLGKGHDRGSRGEGESDWGAYLFGVLFFAVLAWILYSACVAGAQNRRPGGNGRRRGGGGGGGGPGGGGGGGWDPGFGQDDDPPPPYPGTKPSNQGGQQGWRPGFWTGAGAGGAAGYGAGYYHGRNSARNQQGYGTGGWGNDSSSSSWGAGPSRSTSSSSSSARHESTGFGSTNRR